MATNSDSQRKTVLIADPSDATRSSLAHFLREKGMAVVEASDGSKALSETLLHKPAILLIDLAVQILPVERLVQILRSNPNTKSIPIFFLSEKEASVSGFRHGVDEFIRKPFLEEEVLLRIHRSIYQDQKPDAITGDSEIAGNLAQIFLPDLWQMLSMYRKSGIVQMDGVTVSGSVYIDKGEIVSAVCGTVSGEKALYRLAPLREGKFRFLPGKVDVRRTVHAPSQQALLEGLRQFDELNKISSKLPSPDDTVTVAQDVRMLSGASGAVREIIVLAEFCHRIGDIVDNCTFPDLVAYEAIVSLAERGVMTIGDQASGAMKSGFLPPDELLRLRTRMEDKGGVSDGRSSLSIVFFTPDSGVLESLVIALGAFREFEIDVAFLRLRQEGSVPMGMFGRMRIGERGHIPLYAFPYLRATSPLWFTLAPRPIGVVAFLKDEAAESSLEGLLAVADYAKGTESASLIAAMGKTFVTFGLGENTLKLFRTRYETLGGRLDVVELNRIAADKIAVDEVRGILTTLVRDHLDGASR